MTRRPGSAAPGEVSTLGFDPHRWWGKPLACVPAPPPAGPAELGLATSYCRSVARRAAETQAGRRLAPRHRATAALGLAFLLAFSAAAAAQSQPSAAQLQQNARAAVAAGQPGPAVRALTAALQHDPNWPEGLWDLGSILYEGGQIASARQAFGRLTVLVPTRGAAWAMLGLCDFAAHDYGMSLRHLQHGRSLGLSPAALADTARLHEAQDFLVLGQYTQASHLLDPFALRDDASTAVVATFGLAALHLPVLPTVMHRVLSPSRAQLVLAAGRALAAAADRHNTAAEAALRSLIRAHPQALYLHYNLGQLLAAQGHNAAAVTAFEEELRLNPRSAATHLQLVAAELQTADYAAAERNARQAVRLRPNSFAAHYLLGLTLFRENQLEAAARELEISKRLQPGVSDVRYTLAQVDLRLHRTQAALREEKAFRRLAPLSSSFRLKGNLPASVYEHPKSGTP